MEQKIILTWAIHATRKRITTESNNIFPQGLSRSYTICPRPYSSVMTKSRLDPHIHTLDSDSFLLATVVTFQFPRVYSCQQRVRQITLGLPPPTPPFKIARMQKIILRMSKESVMQSFSSVYWIPGKLLRTCQYHQDSRALTPRIIIPLLLIITMEITKRRNESCPLVNSSRCCQKEVTQSVPV